MVGLARWMDHRPAEMSGGQQQRLSIARAIATRPALILADEPTGELDSGTTRQIAALFRHLVEKERVTILLTTHNPILVEYADRVYYLKDGQLSN
jgi:ABC-type lipoprotein export system ATPase subunit